MAQRIRLDKLLEWEVSDGYTLTHTWMEGEVKFFRFAFSPCWEGDAVNGRRLLEFIKTRTQGTWGDPARWEIVEEDAGGVVVSYRHADRDGEFAAYPWNWWPFLTPGGLSGMSYKFDGCSFRVYYNERMDELEVEGCPSLFEAVATFEMVTAEFGIFRPAGKTGHYRYS